MTPNTPDSGEKRLEDTSTSGAGTILLLAASEFESNLSKCIKNGYCVRATDDLKSASSLFKSEQPVLIICGLDGEGWKLIPLLRTARHNNVPILALAFDHGTLDAIPVITWALDRSRKELIAPLAMDLIKNPDLVPNDLERCPPPPPSEEEIEKESESNRQQLIQESSERLASTAPSNLDSMHPIPELTTPEPPILRNSSPAPPGDSPLPAQWEAHLEERIVRIESSIHASLQQAWRESAVHMEQQSEAILALRERIGAVATHSETMSEEISGIVKNIAEMQTDRNNERKKIEEAIASATEQNAAEVLQHVDDVKDDFNALSAVFHEITGAISEESETNQEQLKEMLDIVKADVELAGVAMQEQVERAVEMSDWVSSKTETVEKRLADFKSSKEESDSRQTSQMQEMAKRFSALEKEMQRLSSSRGSAASKAHGTPDNQVSSDFINARFDAIEVSIKGLQTATSADQDRKLILAQLEDLRLVQTELIDRIEDLERVRATGMTLASAEQSADLSEKVRVEIAMQLSTLRQGQSLLTKRISKVESRPPEPVTRSDPPPSPAIEAAMRDRLRQSAAEIQRLTQITKAVEAKLVALDTSFHTAEKQRQFDAERYNTAIKAGAGHLTEMEKRFFAVETILRRVDPKADGELAWHLNALKGALDDVARRLTVLESTPRVSSPPHASSEPPSPPSSPPDKPSRRGRMDSKTMQMPYTVTPVSTPPPPVPSGSSSVPPKHPAREEIPPESGKTLEKVRESLAKFQEEYLNRTNEKN